MPTENQPVEAEAIPADIPATETKIDSVTKSGPVHPSFLVLALIGFIILSVGLAALLILQLISVPKESSQNSSSSSSSSSVSSATSSSPVSSTSTTSSSTSSPSSSTSSETSSTRTTTSATVSLYNSFSSSRYNMHFEYPAAMGDIKVVYEPSYFNDESISFTNSKLTMVYWHQEGSFGSQTSETFDTADGKTFTIYKLTQGVNNDKFGVSAIDGATVVMLVQSLDTQQQQTDYIALIKDILSSMRFTAP